MNRIAIWSLLILSTLGPLVVAEVRADDTCTAGCVGDSRSCVQGAGTAKLACRVECKASAGAGVVGSCRRDCRATFRAERAACRADMLDCVTVCEAADAPEQDTSDPACPGTCGAALGQCLRGAAGGMPQCLRSCAKGPDHHACIGECVSTADGGAAACKAEHDACLAGCGGATMTSTTVATSTTFATSTTLATSTTVATSTTSTTAPLGPCELAAAPTCGGLCTEPTQTCMEVEPGTCGCVSGSPTAAFVRSSGVGNGRGGR